MNAPALIQQLRDRTLRVAEQLTWLPPLLARLSVGSIFLMTGWGKLHDLDRVTSFFTSLHLPAPHFQAALVGWTELVCGALLLAGLATRLAALPPIVVMIVAILTAKRPEVHGLTDLVGLDEFVYIVVFAWLAIGGPGAVSLDRVIAHLWKSRHPSKST